MYLNIEKNEVQTVPVPLSISNEIIDKVVLNQQDKCYLRTTNESYICLDKNRHQVEGVNNSLLPEMMISEEDNKQNERWNEILKLHGDCNNFDVKDDVMTITL